MLGSILTFIEMFVFSVLRALPASVDNIEV